MTEKTISTLPPAFARLAWSNLAAQAAEQVALAATPIVAVLSLGAGAGETGLLQTAQTLPFLLLAIPAGLLADRMARRRLMASAEALRVVALSAILALVFGGALNLPALAVLGFVGACGTVVYSVAAPALVPSLVPPDALTRANGRVELARTVAFTAGPALGGVLVGWAGGEGAFALAALLSAAAVILLAGLKEPARAAPAQRDAIGELREGIAFVAHHPLLMPIFLTQFVFNAAFFVLQAVYVPYAAQKLGLSASQIGVTLAFYGAGMICGALLAPWLARRLQFGTVIAIGPICGLVAAIVMVMTIAVPSFGLACLSFFLVGSGPLVWVVSTTTLRQAVTPRHLLGRVSATSALAYGARPIGAGIGALAGGLYGPEVCLVLAAGGFLVQALLILVSPVPRLVRQPAMAV